MLSREPALEGGLNQLVGPRLRVGEAGRAGAEVVLGDVVRQPVGREQQPVAGRRRERFDVRRAVEAARSRGTCAGRADTG